MRTNCNVSAEIFVSFLLVSVLLMIQPLLRSEIGGVQDQRLVEFRRVCFLPPFPDY